MKRIIALVLAFSLILSGCSTSSASKNTSETEAVKTTETSSTTVASVEESNPVEEAATEEESATETTQEATEIEPVDSKVPAPEPVFTSLNDPVLLNYVENTVYTDVSKQLGDGYRVENVSTSYIKRISGGARLQFSIQCLLWIFIG